MARYLRFSLRVNRVICGSRETSKQNVTWPNRCIFKTTKSEIRISKYETISKFEYQMTKIFRELIQNLQDIDMFWILDLCHSYLFRISYFELRISRKLNKQINSILSTCYLFKWLSSGKVPGIFFNACCSHSMAGPQSRETSPIFIEKTHPARRSKANKYNKYALKPQYFVVVNYWHTT